MRYAILSDIHANLQAWNAVLLDLRCNHVDKIVCLGDCLGYGPNPAEVLRSVHANVDFLVLGNHDAVVCGKMDAALFNDAAREIIAWTARQLNRDAIAFLRSLPLCLAGSDFRCTHGDFSQPGAFNYVIDPEDARASWQARPEQLLFVGHTHAPAIFVLGPSGTPHAVAAQDFELEPDKRYLVNVGSVGQPRDGEPRAGYGIYDTAARAVFWRRVPFDLDAFRQALAAAGVPAAPSYFLRHDPRIGRPPLRELLNFSPAKTPEQAARDVVEVRSLDVLQRKVRKWKLSFALLLLLAAGSAAAAGAAWWRHAHRLLLIDGGSMTPVEAMTAAADANLLPMPASATAAGDPIPNWEIRLGNRRKQNALAADAGTGDGIEFRLASETLKDPIRVSARPLTLAPGMNVTVRAKFRKSDDFQGAVAAVVSVTKRNGAALATTDEFIVKEPNLPRAGGWMEAKATETLPANTVAVQVHIRGTFAGSVAVRDLALTCRQPANVTNADR